jgi:hypothetical protein
MKKLLLLFLLPLSLIAKPKLEGSLMLFTDGAGKIGIGGISAPFFKVNLDKKVSIGASLAPIIWIDADKGVHNFGQAGFVVRVDYNKVSFGYNILTIAGVDTKFFGLGYKF